MAIKSLPSQEVLRQLLRYEPDTGKLFWKKRSLNFFKGTQARSKEHACAHWNARHAGKEALIGTSLGYRWGRILGTPYLAHRIIWVLSVGSEPNMIDHINGDRSDNRISNLRSVTSAQNGKNHGMNKNNSSGFKGVSWVERDQRWMAYITCDRKRVSLGHHKCPTAAHLAYCRASFALHGEFARCQ